MNKSFANEFSLPDFEDPWLMWSPKYSPFQNCTYAPERPYIPDIWPLYGLTNFVNVSSSYFIVSVIEYASNKADQKSTSKKSSVS